jgi:hypothetical protein
VIGEVEHHQQEEQDNVAWATALLGSNVGIPEASGSRPVE